MLTKCFCETATQYGVLCLCDITEFYTLGNRSVCQLAPCHHTLPAIGPGTYMLIISFNHCNRYHFTYSKDEEPKAQKI